MRVWEQYINGKYYQFYKFDERYSLTVRNWKLSDMKALFKRLENLLSTFNVDMKPYKHELNRISLSTTKVLCTFDSSYDEIKRLKEYEQTINGECRAIIDNFITNSSKEGFNILKEMLSSEYEYILPDERVNEIENNIISLKSKLTLDKWVEKCDEVLLKINEQRIWKNYSLSDIDSAIKERKDKITENQELPAKIEQKNANDKIKELVSERQNLSFFSFSKKKSIDEEIDSLWQKIRALDIKVAEQSKEQANNIENIKKEIKVLEERKANLKKWHSMLRYYSLCIEILKEAAEPISSKDITKLLIAKDNTFKGFRSRDMEHNLLLLRRIGVVNLDDEQLWSLADIPQKEINDKILFYYEPDGIE